MLYVGSGFVRCGEGFEDRPLAQTWPLLKALPLASSREAWSPGVGIEVEVQTCPPA